MLFSCEGSHNRQLFQTHPGHQGLTPNPSNQWKYPHQCQQSSVLHWAGHSGLDFTGSVSQRAWEELLGEKAPLCSLCSVWQC